MNHISKQCKNKKYKECSDILCSHEWHDDEEFRLFFIVEGFSEERKELFITLKDAITYAEEIHEICNKEKVIKIKTAIVRNPNQSNKNWIYENKPNTFTFLKTIHTFHKIKSKSYKDYVKDAITRGDLPKKVLKTTNETNNQTPV